MEGLALYEFNAWISELHGMDDDFRRRFAEQYVSVWPGDPRAGDELRARWAHFASAVHARAGVEPFAPVDERTLEALVSTPAPRSYRDTCNLYLVQGAEPAVFNLWERAVLLAFPPGTSPRSHWSPEGVAERFRPFPTPQIAREDWV
jgi:hypothetical protein